MPKKPFKVKQDYCLRIRMGSYNYIAFFKTREKALEASDKLFSTEARLKYDGYAIELWSGEVHYFPVKEWAYTHLLYDKDGFKGLDWMDIALKITLF